MKIFAFMIALLLFLVYCVPSASANGGGAPDLPITWQDNSTLVAWQKMKIINWTRNVGAVTRYDSAAVHSCYVEHGTQTHCTFTANHGLCFDNYNMMLTRYQQRISVALVGGGCHQR
jgi:hypothetical protein